MGRIIGWLRMKERRILLWANSKPLNKTINRWVCRWLSTITHMGGATFTLSTAALTALAAPAPWRTTGVQCLVAVIVSHLPVAFVKRTIKRLRPYQALQGVRTYKSPLVDSSFPSGHTTAVFAWLLPILLTTIREAPAALPVVVPACLVIGLSVAWSRMFLGLHYPSDVAAGAVLGSLTALAACTFMPLPSS
ncbi:phosphatase PAP2 family protein [Paenibacillus beijingensis]|uniref:Phosphoesterase n=1 Tax=Paenibacillus beijingensis TaxID=1126833 RepID=A0A0D5NEA7_9BACL|nr:phosphatase PAP2 family protein [Paenibacillus beijingensis]AJY73699.1 phosphoesterase [Paenibacillus beijingensis]